MISSGFVVEGLQPCREEYWSTSAYVDPPWTISPPPPGFFLPNTSVSLHVHYRSFNTKVFIPDTPTVCFSTGKEQQRWTTSHVTKPVQLNVLFSKLKSFSGPGSVVGIATAYGLDGPGIEPWWGEIFRTSPDRPWDPPSLLYNGYRFFPGGKVLSGRDADPKPPSSAEV